MSVLRQKQYVANQYATTQTQKMDFKNTNSAVIKSMFMQMKKDVFVQNVKLLKQEYLELKPNFYNQNYERKLWQLYKFATLWYCNFWQSKK